MPTSPPSGVAGRAARWEATRLPGHGRSPAAPLTGPPVACSAPTTSHPMPSWRWPVRRSARSVRSGRHGSTGTSGPRPRARRWSGGSPARRTGRLPSLRSWRRPNGSRSRSPHPSSPTARTRSGAATAPACSARAMRSATHSEEILAAEARLLARGEDRGAPVVDLDVIEDASIAGKEVLGHRLSDEQVATLASIAVSGRRVDLLIGPAGAGKTTAMRALHAAWTRVHGPGQRDRARTIGRCRRGARRGPRRRVRQHREVAPRASTTAGPPSAGASW